MTKSRQTAPADEKDRNGPAPLQAITRTVMSHVAAIARDAGATAILVYADALPGGRIDLPEKMAEKVIYVTRTAQEYADRKAAGRRCIRVPDVPLTRMGQIKVAVLLALSRGLIRPGDVVVFPTGIAQTGILDTVMITEVGREFEIYSASERGDDLPSGVGPEVLERVLDLAAELGSEGREGRPVGALFTVGDAAKVLSLSRQLILNPFRGYPEKERNILDPALEETVKELSSIDGAFIVRGDGIIETCGAYLKTSAHEEYELPRGLGARHHAAAGITSVTDAVAVVTSESTGTVTVFRQGRPITEIEKPRSTARQRERFLLAPSGGAGKTP